MRTIDSKKLAICALAAGALVATAVTAIAQDMSKFVIKDGMLATPLTDEEGKIVMVSRKLGNCLACHANKDMAKEPFQGDVGPTLDGAADRYSPEQLRAIVVNPKEVFGEQTVMPAFYVPDPAPRVSKNFLGKTILSDQQVEDVVAYLVTLKE